MMFKEIGLITLFGLLVSGSPLPGQSVPARPEMLKYKPLAFQVPRTKDFVCKLKNGIPVYLAADPNGVPLVRLNLMIRGGQYLEPKGKEGLASLLASLWRAGGTAKIPAEALEERLDLLAASIHSELGPTSGSLSLQTLEKDFKETLDLFMQVLSEPAFGQERLDLAKDAARQLIRSRNDSIDSIAEYQTRFLLHGENTFRSAGMTAASLASISREDLRAFQQRLLHPANLMLAVSGKFDRTAMLDRLNQTLGSLQPGRTAVASPKVSAPGHVRKPGLYLVDKDGPQATVGLTLPGLRRLDPDWPAVVVMNEILGGGGFTSRLMKKLRSDEGLTYGVGSQFGEGPHGQDDFSCGFMTKNRSAAYALRLVFQEIDRLKRDLAEADEVKSIKDGILRGFPSDWANKAEVANTFAKEELEGWPSDWWVDYCDKIRAVTREDIQRVARKYLDPSQAVILVVGKAAETEAGDVQDHPGRLADAVALPLRHLPLRDPLTLQPL